MSAASPVRILVTRCTGRVATVACADLVAAGLGVVGIDVREPEADVGYDFRICDLTEEGALDSHLQDMDAGLHLAAIRSPRPGTPSAIFDLNCAGTFRLFQACADAGVRHVVVASSINAIGYFFGAGLATLLNLRQRHGSEFRDTRVLVEQLETQDPNTAPQLLQLRRTRRGLTRHAPSADHFL